MYFRGTFKKRLKQHVNEIQMQFKTSSLVGVNDKRKRCATMKIEHFP